MFRAKPDMDDALLACLREQQPVLRGDGLVTERPAYLMRARGGTLLENFERHSEAEIDAAHGNLHVGTLREHFAAFCYYVALGDLAEAKAMFPGFVPVNVWPRRGSSGRISLQKNAGIVRRFRLYRARPIGPS